MRLFKAERSPSCAARPLAALCLQGKIGPLSEYTEQSGDILPQRPNLSARQSQVVSERPHAFTFHTPDRLAPCIHIVSQLFLVNIVQQSALPHGPANLVDASTKQALENWLHLKTIFQGIQTDRIWELCVF